MEDIILLKMVSQHTEDGEITIQLVSPVSTVEVTAEAEIAQQIYSQLGQRFLATIESEMENLQFDLTENN